MKKIMVINGPNLNMLGIRERNIYGETSYAALKELLQKAAEERSAVVDIRQSNHEGDLVDWIQEAYYNDYDGIVMNPAAYTHTSIAIADAVKAIAPLPVVEVHISDIRERESFRHVSYAAPYCVKQIKGEGLQGYISAMDVLLEREQ